MTDTLTLTPHEHVRVRRAGASALEVEVRYAPGGKRPPGHFHPGQSERFEILEGVLEARVDGEALTLRPGDSLDVPAGAVHQMFNAGDEPVRAIWETTPAGRTLEWFTALDAVQPAGGGEPGPRAMAPLLVEYDDVFRLSARPRFLVGAVLRLLAFGSRPGIFTTPAAGR